MPPRIINHVTHVLSYQPLAPMLNITLTKPNINIEIFDFTLFHQKKHLCPLLDVINPMANPMNVNRFQMADSNFGQLYLDKFTSYPQNVIFTCLKINKKIG